MSGTCPAVARTSQPWLPDGRRCVSSVHPRFYIFSVGCYFLETTGFWVCCHTLKFISKTHLKSVYLQLFGWLTCPPLCPTESRRSSRSAGSRFRGDFSCTSRERARCSLRGHCISDVHPGGSTERPPMECLERVRNTTCIITPQTWMWVPFSEGRSGPRVQKGAPHSPQSRPGRVLPVCSSERLPLVVMNEQPMEIL